MSSTANLELPLLQQSQAQKHVVVNEALAILDGVAQLTLESLSVATPPANPSEGQAYGLPSGLSGAWTFQAGKIAVFCNGGWRFVIPKAGWSAYVKDQGRRYVHDGIVWLGDALNATSNGAATNFSVLEFDQNVGSGAKVTTTVKIPAYSTVLGVTGRVVTRLNTGSLNSFWLGVPASLQRYGHGFGTAANAMVYGMTGVPLSYFEDTPLVLTAAGGTFGGGKVRLAVHLAYMSVPRS
ncbi:DUF2793 domain-containing protein [Poseidonocella sp. HB161398]|uniref:DUF2793 domain-containing protein n=1 Tax=Poseidonocella sp. HB161398 TaxID=2320855 RepID=UPI0011090831|nr:DUF2793 domain-containing protein [Poseidonocella sp. HB161398]